MRATKPSPPVTIHQSLLVAPSGPFDRDGTVEDVANTVFFLASKEGSYINGQTIHLSGGAYFAS